jgi:hypothetical protein
MSEDDEKANIPRIESSPKASSFEIGDLIELAQRGQLRIPSFQRGFRWKNSDRVALFDSIERGYPIGTLLLWKRYDKVDGGLLAGATHSQEARETYWIVDGQQRITTLWDALARKEEGNSARLYFDLSKDGEFRFITNRAGEDCVPVSVILDTTELSEWLVENRWPVEKRRRAFELGKRIRQYGVPSYIVDTSDERVLRNIFDRTNSTGKALTRDEVFDALAGASEGKEKSLDRINLQLQDTHFGAFDRSTILNAFEAIKGLRLGKSKLSEVAPNVSSDDLNQTAASLRKVIFFLRDSAHIPHSFLVPYELSIIVLARFFHLFPEPNPRSRVLLRRWLWRASLSQQLGRASGVDQQHADDMKENDEHGSVQRLLARSGKEIKIFVQDKMPLHLDTALGKLQAISLLGLRPRDLQTGELLDIEGIFPRDKEPTSRRVFPVNNQEPNSLTRTVANRLMHPSVKGITLARLLLDATDDAALLSHGITAEAAQALHQGNAGTFLGLRADYLKSWSERYFQQHAEWGADDSPPIAALLAGE